MSASTDITPLEEAIRRAIIYAPISDLKVFEKNIYEAHGLIVAEDYYALIDNPPYNKSYVDGFAVIAEDTFGASPVNPIRLRIIGWMKPSDYPSKYVVRRGEAVRVSTGTPLPLNSDAVVMHEDVNEVNSYIEVTRSLSPWSNVAKRGEDYKRGDILVKKGTLLKPWDLALLSSSGYKFVKAYEKIRVGLLCTGSELVEPGFSLKDGLCYESTCALVKNYLDQVTFVDANYYGIVPDDEDIFMERILKIVDENHLAIVSGGAGVSEVDVTKRIISKIGRWVFRNIAIRPGKPTGLALVNGKPVFSLSGFPVAAWVALEALVIPYLHGLLGLKPPVKPKVKAVMKRKVPNTIGYKGFIRVRLFVENGKLFCDPYLVKGSGILSSLAKSDGYIMIPEYSEGIDEGDEVEVILI